MKINSCRWVLRRLPLLDGGELAMDERRRVERHLIGCPDCRGRRSASADALSALRASSGASQARRDVPSLWPALERQIRESRHVPSRPPWSWSWLFAQASPAMSFGLALGGVLAAGFALGRSAPTPSPTGTSASANRTLDGPASRAPNASPQVAKVVVKPRGALPDTPARIMGQPGDPFRVPNTRVGYDLDRGYPMGSGLHDPQRSY